MWEQALRVTWIDLVVPSGGLKTDSNILQPSNGVVHLMSYDLPPSSFLILFMISWLQILNGLPSSTLAFCPHSWGMEGQVVWVGISWEDDLKLE